MQTRRWVNQSQPQTLVIATFLLYAGAVFAILGTTTFLGIALGDTFQSVNRIENIGKLFVAVGGAGAGYLIANEKKAGYFLGLAVAALPIVAKLIAAGRNRIEFVDLIDVNLLFEIALVALIVHPQSRSYVRLWFK